MIPTKIKLKDIADKLNVSVVTVSRALNDKDGVSDELKEKIKETAVDMGYHGNPIAKAMKTGNSLNVGIVIPEYFFHEDNSFYFYYFKCILDTLKNHCYNGILYVASEKEISESVLPHFCYNKTVDGIILLGQISRNYIKLLQSTGIPIILSDFYENLKGIDAVAGDNFHSAYELTGYLVNMGHKRIGFVGSINATSSIHDRYLGYYKAVSEYGLEFEPSLVIEDRISNNQINQKFELPDKMPTAFVCNCDETAYQFIRYLQSIGKKVPEDYSVVCFNNTIYSKISIPSITAWETDIPSMAAITAENIIAKIDGHYPGGTIYVKGKLVKKDSVIPYPS